MIRIICTKCKNAYLQKEGAELTCPNCKEVFPEADENLLSGIQYYNESELSQASDCLMKYIVKNGAEPRAIFYKALCDGFDYDEDTSTLADVYSKIIQSLAELPEEMFIHYLALANDELEKLETLVVEAHIRLFETADAEKIKKEVTAIIKLRDEAKAFRDQLTKLADAYNETATDKISVRFSSCALVKPKLAAEIGELKFNRIAENIASHTVFTGILSTDIKNLEIYYRCIVMFFEKNRQKYDFLLATAGKFEELDKLLAEGNYTALKGVGTIANKLKNAAYDFFQESLKDHDDEFEQQTETVVVIPCEAVAEIPATEEIQEVAEVNEESENTEEATEEAESTEETVEADDTVYETEETADVVEIPVENEKETESAEATDEPAVTEADEPTVEEAAEATEDEVNAESNDAVIEIDAPVQEAATDEAVEEADTVVEIDVDTAEAVKEEAKEDISESFLDIIAQNGTISEVGTEAEEIGDAPVANSSEEAEEPKKRKHKKNYAPIIIVLAVILAVAGLIALKVVPQKLNEKNYAQAEALQSEEKYIEAAAIYAELGDYSDSSEKALLCRYNNALVLEAEGKYAEAKDVYTSLGDYKDSAAKITSCAYNEAISALEDGKYDEAAEMFTALGDYLDCKIKAEECTYKKALALIDAEDYESAIELLETIPEYTGSKDAVLNAKYAYINANLDSKNKTTLAYLEELIKAKYKDCAEIKNKLLGTEDEKDDNKNSSKIVTSVNYSKTDFETNLTEVTNDKEIYFHVTVNDKALYGKDLSIGYTTSYGYPQYKTITLSADDNTYALNYPSTPSVNYTVDFELISDGNVVATQTVTIK